MTSQGELRTSTAVADITDLVSGFFAETDREYSRQRPGHNFCAVWIVRVNENVSRARHNVHQTPETEFDLIETGENVSVVKLDVVDDDGLWQVMKEFGTFVEEGGVVLVSLKDEIVRITKSRALAQISGDSTDQKTRVAAGFTEEPGDQCGGGRFAVCP